MSQKLDEARKILRDYWGTMGPDSTLRAADLRKLKLKDAEIEILLDELPSPGPAPTGQRVAECYRVLERMSR